MPGKSPGGNTLAAAVLRCDPAVLTEITRRPIIVAPDNFVYRPWGGRSLARFKGLQQRRSDYAVQQPWGECFEICADDSDPEASTHPSTVQLADGSSLDLLTLLKAAPEPILGSSLVAKYGVRLPVLPKILNVEQLLSVQAHPAGFTEAYAVIAADAGATLRIGFRQDIDPAALEPLLQRGRQHQVAMLDLLLQEIDQYALQATLSPYFSQREQMPEPCIDHLTRWLRRASDRGALRTALDDLKRIYWYVLDLLNEVPARAGEVIHNVTPKRLSRGPRSAEVHALGNPQGKEILALEVRRPCPTLRAWDHVRFPMREVQIGPTLAALNLQATRPEEFIAPLEPIAGAPHVLRSIEDESFVVKHLRPTANQPVELTRSETVVTLHGLRGRVQLRRPGGSVLAELQQGTSLVVPAAMGDAVVVAEDNNIEVIKIELTL